MPMFQPSVSGDYRPPGGVILLGDSRTFHTLQQTDIDAGNYRLRDNGWFTWANVIAGAQFEIVKNAGVSGDSTSGMLARYDNDVRPFAQQARYMTFLGGTNNIGDDIATAVAALEDAKAIFAKAREDNLYVICISELPRGVAGASINYYNAGLKEYWRNSPNGEYVDAYAGLVNPTSASGGSISGIYYDGIHLDVRGALLLGRIIAPTLTRLRGAPPSLISSVVDTRGNNSSSDQICDFGLFAASGGTAGSNASGDIGLGWTLARVGGTGTVAGSLETPTDGIGKIQRITITATGATANTFRLTLSSSVHARATPGKVLRCRAKISLVSGTNVHTLALRVTKTTGELTCLNQIGGTGFITEAFGGVYATWKYTIPPGGETNLVSFVECIVTGAGAAVVDISRLEMRLSDG